MKFEAGIIAPDALESDAGLFCTEDRGVKLPSALGLKLAVSADEGIVILRDIEHGERAGRGYKTTSNFLVHLNTLIYIF